MTKSGKKTALNDLAKAVLGVLSERPSSTNASAAPVAPHQNAFQDDPNTHVDTAAPVFSDDEPDTRRFLNGGSSGVRLASSIDRRAARRVALVVPVDVDFRGDHFDGTSEDISTTGLFVRTERLLPSGRRIKLRFDLPHGVIETIGVVVRFRTPTKHQPGGIGLCFQGLSEEQEACIEAFCDAAADSVH